LWDQIEKARAHVKDHPEDWADTRLYFFFSGHGIAPIARDSSGLAADAGPYHYGKAVSMKLLVEYLLDAQPFAQLVIIGDCCRNWPGDAVPPAGPPWTPDRTQNGDVRVAEFYATIYGDPAREPDPGRDPNAERGYFTRAILEGLRGGALDDPQTGTVTCNSLIEYARKRVIEETGGKQKPPQDIGASLVLAEGVAAPIVPEGKQSVRITFDAGLTGPVVLRDAKLAKVDETVANGSDWVVDLAPGFYLAELGEGTEINFEVSLMEGEFNVSLAA
jgi:uncharacterized caspase-like protein